jgi:GTP-binding protein HflX
VDTVGFVRKLPHALVAAFRATLEEVAEADLILRLVDAAETNWAARLESVDAVLKEVFELYLPGKPLPPQWLAFNKTDLLGPSRLKALKAQEPEAAFVSAVSGDGLQALKLRLRAHFEEDLKVQSYLIPHESLGELSRQFPKMRIKKQEWLAAGLKVEAVLSQPLPALEPFRLKPPKRKA